MTRPIKAKTLKVTVIPKLIKFTELKRASVAKAIIKNTARPIMLAPTGGD